MPSVQLKREMKKEKNGNDPYAAAMTLSYRWEPT